MSERFRSSEFRRAGATSAILVALASVIALVAASGGAAQTTGPRTITIYEQNKDSDHSFIDNKPYSPKGRHNGPRISRGDEIVFSIALVDEQGASAGREDFHCSDTVPGDFTRDAILACAGGLRLPDGTLTAQAITSVTAKVTTIAITGGTGAYAGATGSMVATTLSDTKSKDVITLTN